MRRLILILPIFLMACGQPETETVYLMPDIPVDLLVPCAVSARVAETYRDLAVLATEHLNTAQCANGKIEALGQILTPKAKA
jgi:hypothetical protein